MKGTSIIDDLNFGAVTVESAVVKLGVAICVLRQATNYLLQTNNQALRAVGRRIAALKL